ncbi:MAG TPA: T9SS type A sorting domain-containing protein [Ignavibacteriaceae bacterium]|nr:T9SS type A sorting domain-containing protein [Ignavibacteriaceae bacterium]
MKLVKAILIFLIFLSPALNAQDIQVIVHDSFKYEHFSVAEIVLEFEVINISSQTQTVFEVRTINNLPANWTSSLCFGQLCFAPELDSIATAPPFPEPPLEPGDTLITSLHVFTDQVSIGTANVQLQVGTFRNPNDRIILDFVATTDPTVNVQPINQLLQGYFLLQNYPNPFNPSTMINFGIKEAGNVSIKIYNILGSEIAEVVNDYFTPGTYSYSFDASELSSGIYLYKIISNDFVQTRKMILQK